MSEGVTGSEGGGGRLIRVGVAMIMLSSPSDQQDDCTLRVAVNQAAVKYLTISLEHTKGKGAAFDPKVGRKLKEATRFDGL